MSSTRILKAFTAPVHKIGSVRTIYSASHQHEIEHWLELHKQHTTGHKHAHGPLFDHHRHLHTDSTHATIAPKPPHPSEDVQNELTFKAW